MKRKFEAQLNNWYESGTKVPLLVRGVRGVGKTSSVLEFARNKTGQGYLYINFETDFRAINIFKRNTSIRTAVSEYFNIEESFTERFLIILDEIQVCDSLINALECPVGDCSIKVIYLSSFMPKGEYEAVNAIFLYPMDFDEYLDACGKSWYSEVIKGHFERQKQIPGMIFDELSDLYYEYVRLGGMPGVIADYIKNESLDKAYALQREAYMLIMNDILSYGRSEAVRMRELIEAIPAHIEKRKLKFTPGIIRRGLTKNMFMNAAELLENNGIIVKALNILSEEDMLFRIFDSGIYKYIISSSRLHVDKNFNQDFLSELLTENSVCCKISQKHKLYYWESSGQAKIECIFEKNNSYTPVDFELSGSKRRKSIGLYQSIYKPDKIYRIGNENFVFKSEVATIPAFSAGLL